MRSRNRSGVEDTSYNELIQFNRSFAHESTATQPKLNHGSSCWAHKNNSLFSLGSSMQNCNTFSMNFMPKYFTIIFFLICNHAVLSQNTDSLKHLLPFRQKQEKAELLLTLSKAYWYTKRDTALLYASEALQFSRNISYARGIAEAYRHLGVINMYSANLHIAQPQMDTALRLFQQLKDTIGMAATYNNIGVLMQRDLGRYDESILAFERALPLFQKMGNLEGTGSVLNYLGLAYQQQGNFQKAIEYLLQGMEVRKKIGDIRGVMFSLSRVGDVYQALEQTETALKYYMKALHFADEKKVEPNSDTYESLAKLYMGSKRYEEAKKYIDLAIKAKFDVEWYNLLLGRYYMETGLLEKSLVVYKQIMTRTQKNSDYGVFATGAMEISKIYQFKKDYPAALKYAKNAYEIASKHNIRWIIADAANSLSSLYAIKRDYRKAYNYEKIYRSISDSISKADSHLKLAFLESKNEVLEKQSSIELLNKENQVKEQRLQNEALIKKFFIGGIVVMLIIAFVLFRNMLLKRKNEKHLRELAENELQIQKLETEKTKTELLQQAAELKMQALQAQMNPHFIFNSLNSISRFILKNQRIEANDYLTKFSRLIRLTLQNSAMSTVKLKNELNILQLYLELECLRFGKKIMYEFQYDPNLETELIEIPPLLLQPYIENALWHGLMLKKEEGHLGIKIEQQEQYLVCTITDDGIGRKKAAELKNPAAATHKSMGMNITANRIALLNQSKQLRSDVQIIDLVLEDGSPGGTQVIINLPLYYD
jgi:tetratricopeptide (TPR) repeat protein